jgi:hypothetical protein
MILFSQESDRHKFNCNSSSSQLNHKNDQKTITGLVFITGQKLEYAKNTTGFYLT